MVATSAALVAAAGVYLLYRQATGEEVGGGSALGLAYGILGSALMVFAGLLAARKKALAWRVGRAQAWLRGHLWLGLLSLPLILFHSDFHFGGLLTTLLMVLLLLVIVSGVAGAALQHFLPRLMTSEVPMETIYEEIGNVRAQLRADADRRVAAVCGPLPGVEEEKPAGAKPAPPAAEVDAAAQARLREFYLDVVRPFLEPAGSEESVLAQRRAAGRAFDQLRILLPGALLESVNHLEDACEEARQLTRQARMHRWLHGWLLVHLPLSFALLVLAAVHAVVALRY